MSIRDATDEQLYLDGVEHGERESIAELMRRDRVEWGEEVPTTESYIELVGGW